MSHNQHYKKVKRYRDLKIVFYVFGLPCFVLAVFLSAIKFIGHDPFVGGNAVTSEVGFFMDIEALLTSPALYGLWAALAFWAIISIAHIILAKTVKSWRARMLTVVALCLVILIGGTFCMDAVLEAKVSDIIAQEAASQSGVIVEDYKTQLSYYRILSSEYQKMNDTQNLIDKVHLLKNVYHVEMDGVNKSGVAGNISNKPVTYYNVISDTGVSGVDISFKAYPSDPNNDSSAKLWKLNIDASGNLVGDGKKTKEVEGNQLIRLAPNANGQLEINGEVFSHYVYNERETKAGEKIYVWYTKDMMPVGTAFGAGTSDVVPIDGRYGYGVYNHSGLIGDGWIFSFDNVLNILEDYYEGLAIIEQLDPTGSIGRQYAEMAAQMRDSFYKGNSIKVRDGEYASTLSYSSVTVDENNNATMQLDADNLEFIKTLYTQDSDLEARFSLTRGDLDFLVSKLGAFLGDNSLFDFLLKPTDDGGTGLEGFLDSAGLGSVADMLEPILGQLSKGLDLGSMLGAETMATVGPIVKAAVDCSEDVNGLWIVLTYGGQEDPWGNEREGMYLSVVKDNGKQDADGKWIMGDESDVLLDIDFRDALLDEGESDYAFDLDHLSEFLNNTIDNLLGHFNISLKGILVDNTIGSLVGGLLIKDIYVDGELFKGLEIAGIQIPLFDEEYNAKIDINGILVNLVKGLYSYQSAIFMPTWEFYELIPFNVNANNYEVSVRLAKAYAQFERANYMATVHGSMIGSTLIGDMLGEGTYASALGLNDLVSVRQLQVDLSYKPVFYPLYALREMVMFFAGLAIFWYFLSFVMAEKERECAAGNVYFSDGVNPGRKDKDERKKKEDKNNDVISDVKADDKNPPVDKEGKPALPQDQNNTKGGAVR